MQDASQVTLKNRTGMQISPVQGRELLESLELEVADAPQDADGGPGEPTLDDVALRRDYIRSSGPLGTIPPPLSVKGVAKSAAKMLTGRSPQVLLDKLAERAAFERGGTRLYDALLVKYAATPRADLRPIVGADGTASTPASAPTAAGASARAIGSGGDDISEGALLEIRNQEAEHYQLLAGCIAKLGGDPTAETPSANLVGVQTIGLVQVVTDPRTNLMQSLQATLAAELIDVAGWELLVSLAEAMGQDEMVDLFQTALEEEEEHLRLTQAWYSVLVLAESGN